MKTRILALMLFTGVSMFARTHVFFSFGYAAPAPVVTYYAPPPPPPVYYAPAAPGIGYSWVNGYYYPVGPRWVWHRGYWARPPFARAYWVGPRYYGGRYYRGYWGRRW